MKTIITKEKKPWLWQIKQGRKIIAGGYCRTKKDAKADAATWLRHNAKAEALSLSEVDPPAAG